MVALIRASRFRAGGHKARPYQPPPLCTESWTCYICRMPLSEGTQVGVYEILSLIGKGGMGEVYRAHDPRLDREVAIKALTESLLQEDEALLRFEQEAKALASLSHPNILTVHDIVIEGRSFFVVMELLKGETLRDRLKREKIPWKESLPIAMAIGEGLAAAHSRGIIHRDLKPENVFLTQDNQIKILDFGLARVEPKMSSPGESWMDTSPALSHPGIVMGTLRSMAPEQLRGQTVDARTDIYSLGCILYEMISGRVPFDKSDAAELTASILRDRPAAIDAGSAPQELIDLTFRCLQKDAAMRLPSARDVVVKLRSVPFDAQLSRSGAVRRSSRGRGRSVAILPIGFAGGDPEDEYLMDGITESIINSLSQLPKLKVTARSTAFRYKGQDIDPREVGRALGVQMLMTGRGVRRGERLNIQVELVHAEDGSQVWGQQFSRNLSDIFSVQEEIASVISTALQRKLTGAEKKLLGKRYTENVEAYQFYLKGRYYWNRRTPEAFEKAITFFEQAIETDPTFALAYSGIADCYNFLGWEAYGFHDPKVTYPRAIAAATRALEIDDSLAEGYNSLAWAKWAFTHDWEGAEKDYRRAIKLNPGYALAHVWYADLLAGSGRLDPALAEIRIAQILDPLAAVTYAVHALILYFSRDYAASRVEAGKALELQPDFPSAFLILGRGFMLEGKYPEAIEAMKSAMSHSENHPRMVAGLAHAYAASGKTEDARRILDELRAIAEQKYLPALIDVGLAYAALGEKETAFEWLEKAYRERTALLVWLYPDPLADPLRSDPRFDDLMRRIGLNPS